MTSARLDNIPGAKGIGPKTAAKLLQDYGTLEHILENLGTVKPESAAKKIEASLQDVRFSHELSRIITDAELDIDPERWSKREPQREREIYEAAVDIAVRLASEAAPGATFPARITSTAKWSLPAAGACGSR